MADVLGVAGRRLLSSVRWAYIGPLRAILQNRRFLNSRQRDDSTAIGYWQAGFPAPGMVGTPIVAGANLTMPARYLRDADTEGTPVLSFRQGTG
ncbi:MAG: hypothetical protein ACREDC_06370 [Bradyrhizobium sp.]